MSVEVGMTVKSVVRWMSIDVSVEYAASIIRFRPQPEL
jgi:hypothetical protein